MTPISLKQLQERLLSMATIVDQICQNNNIPLYMTVGTMLGAIRHKGFIPWDDDIDFAIPYQYYPLLKKVLKQDLPSNLRLLSFEDSRSYKSPWIKVEDTESLVIDKCLDLPDDQMPGLTIDIFPLVNCSKCSHNFRRVKRIQHLILLLRFLFTKPEGRIRICAVRVIQFLFPHLFQFICSSIMRLCNGLKEGDYYINPVDPVYKNRFFPVKWFSPLTRYKFENASFYGIADYDNYLTEIYHDYMKLPPEDQRRTHLNNVYIK